TRGYERFRYDYVAPISSSEFPYSQANRGVVERWISPSGDGSEENSNHWVYSIVGGPYRTITTAPNCTRTERLIYGGAPGGNLPAPFGFEDPREGMSYEGRTYNPSNQMLRRSLTEWQVSGPQPGGYVSAQRDPRVTRSVNLLLDTGGNVLAANTTTQ